MLHSDAVILTLVGCCWPQLYKNGSLEAVLRGVDNLGTSSYLL